MPYEISSTASSNKVAIIGDLSTVPTKEIGVRLNAEYCNTEGYNPETDEFDHDKNTFYEINYKGTIMDKLVIPYQIEYKGELCKVAEVDLTVGFEKAYACFGIPRVKEIIIPNTVKKLKAQNYMSSFNDSSIPNEKLENIVFSNKLKEIPEELFRGCTNIRTVTIPSSVEKIGDGTYSDLFWDCPNLETINIMKEEGSIPGYETKWGAEEDVVINWLGEE